MRRIHPFDVEAIKPHDAPVSAGRTRRAKLLLLVAALTVVAVGGAWVLLRGDDGVPDEWDERLVGLVGFVEDERGLEFRHPVAVDFLHEDEWAEQADIDEEELLDEEAQLLERGEGMFRAVGLAEGDLDLLASSEQLGTSGTVGLYLFDEERIAVRGEALTLRVRATLVHELTHALQDQHYDIGDRLQRLADSGVPSPEASLRVLVEGDADRIEQAWRAALDDDERAELDEQEQEQGDAATAALEELPASLVTFFASDYILGSGFVGVLEADRGQDAIDRAFADPPGPDEHVLDPLSYLRDDERGDVDPPDVPGEPIEDLDGEFGAVSLYLVLAERTDPAAALAAVDGWDGDAYRAYVDDGRTCVALRVSGEDADAANRLAGVLDEWSASMPGAAGASVDHDRRSRVVDVTVCDPGVDADLVEGDGRSQQTIIIPATRAELARQVLDSDGTLRQAACFSSGIVERLPYELFVTEEPTPDQQAEIDRIVTDVVILCR